MPDIYKATYSGVPVYEMTCKSIAVMRRRVDSWLNATQILKVAGFDKPQRTRVLEREVQKGEHEKVQGGYGKYQGTWVPLERGLAISRQYNVETLLRPIIDFVPSAQSPPLAPKHLAAAPSQRAKRKEPPVVEMTPTTRSSRGARIRSPALSSASSRGGDDDGSLTSSPSEVSSSSRTPSPIRSSAEEEEENEQQDTTMAPPPKKKKRKVRVKNPPVASQRNELEVVSPDHYADIILEYFISDTSQIPTLLTDPPPDFDPNIIIDNDGHTALHWAAAMGRIKVMKYLLNRGADEFKVNKAGQTALMRSVMFANNYDIRKFGELYELLHRSTLNIDNANRTVFHHVVDVAMSKELADIINFQDEDGETALTMSARCRSKRLVEILIEHGADPKICNREGKNTEDYIVEDERFRASPTIASRTLSMSYRNRIAATTPSTHPQAAYLPPSTTSPLYHSLVAQRAATTTVDAVASILGNLAQSYDRELGDMDRDLKQAGTLLSNIQTEVTESKRIVDALRTQASGLDEGRKALSRMEEELRAKMGKRYRLGWEKWVKDEEERERRAFAAGIPAIAPSVAAKKDEISDLIALHANIPPSTPLSPPPSNPSLSSISSHISLAEASVALRAEIAELQTKRQVSFDELVKSQAEAGTGGRMSEYRRLIGAGCGGVPPAEVDGVIGMLLETLEAEESNPSFVWGNPLSLAAGGGVDGGGPGNGGAGTRFVPPVSL